MVMILIKTPDEWATTKQACMVELEFRIFFYFFFPPHYVLRSCPMY